MAETQEFKRHQAGATVASTRKKPKVIERAKSHSKTTTPKGREQLPAMHIVSFLDMSDTRRCRGVNRQWKEACDFSLKSKISPQAPMRFSLVEDYDRQYFVSVEIRNDWPKDMDSRESLVESAVQKMVSMGGRKADPRGYRRSLRVFGRAQGYFWDDNEDGQSSFDRNNDYEDWEAKIFFGRQEIDIFEHVGQLSNFHEEHEGRDGRISCKAKEAILALLLHLEVNNPHRMDAYTVKRAYSGSNDLVGESGTMVGILFQTSEGQASIKYEWTSGPTI